MTPELIAYFIQYLDISGEDVEIISFASQLLAQVEDYIYNTYDISINPRTLIEYHDGKNSKKLYTTKGRITSVNSIIVGGVALDISSIITTGNSIYIPDNTFPTGVDNIMITYSVGFTNYTDIPPSLLNAMFSIGKKMYTDITKNLENFSMVSSDIKQSVRPVDKISYLTDTTLQAFKIFKL
jgi:hypothetical protein